MLEGPTLGAPQTKKFKCQHLTFYSFLKLVAFKLALSEGGVGEQVTQKLALRQPVPELAQFGKIVFLLVSGLEAFPKILTVPFPRLTNYCTQAWQSKLLGGAYCHSSSSLSLSSSTPGVVALKTAQSFGQ